MKTGDLFSVPVNSLPVSVDFIEACLVMGYGTLGEVVALPVQELISNKGFTYSWLHELSCLLMKHGQLNALQSFSKNTGA